jgi:pyruvate dehydrogenase E2 component (dihydrolipoamide acetyltransferase)
MSTPIRLPALSSDFASGTLASWHKALGDAVKKGDVLFEVENDKATVAVEAEESGILSEILIPAGSQQVAVNTIVGILLTEGEKPAALAPPTPARLPATAPGRVYASPLARRIASQRGVDLLEINGSGPRGRILKIDVETAAAKARLPDSSQTGHASAHTPARVQDIPNSNIRKVIAQRLTAAKRDIPHFYLTIDCEIDALLNVRQQLNEHYTGSDIRISVNDCVVKAAALALRDVPAANASWSEVAIHRFETIDISVAVATEAGLLTPILRNADCKPLSELSQEMKRLATRAHAGQLKQDEFKGGGFSISNLGMYGIKSFSAIINPPQSCILAVGAGEKRPIVRGDQVTIATVMTCTLSVDHRSVDGAVGAQFLNAFKKYIERPAVLLLNHA